MNLKNTSHDNRSNCINLSLKEWTSFVVSWTFFLFSSVICSASATPTILRQETLPPFTREELEKRRNLALEESSAFIRKNAEKRNFLPELEKILQTGKSFRTISISYKIEMSTDNGKTWKPYSENRVMWDKVKNLSYFSSRRDISVKRENAKRDITGERIEEKTFGEGVLTSVDRHSYQLGSNKVIQKSSAKITQEPKWLSFPSGFLLNYTNIGGENSIFKNDSFSFHKPIITKTNYKGKAALKVENYIFHKEKPIKPGSLYDKVDWPIMVIFFDVETGRLLEITRIDINYNETKLTRGMEFQILVDEYFQSNGLYFPSILRYLPRVCDGVQVRFVVDKKTAKLNEILDEKSFIPSIPPQADVIDTIKGTRYIAPSIGNIGAEKQIRKELDELFKEAKK